MSNEDSTARGSGRTTAQIKAAPKGATFVWVNSNTFYPVRLAKSLGRGDLFVVGPGAVGHRMVGAAEPVVVDHAAVLTHAQWRLVEESNRRYAARSQN